MSTSFVVIWTCQHKITRPCKHYCNIQGVHRRFCTSKMADSRFIMEMHYCSHFWMLRPSFVRKLHYWVLNLWSYRAYKLQCWFSRKSLLPFVKGEHKHFGADSLATHLSHEILPNMRWTYHLRNYVNKTNSFVTVDEWERLQLQSIPMR